MSRSSLIITTSIHVNDQDFWYQASWARFSQEAAAGTGSHVS